MLSIQRFFGAFRQYVILDVRNYLTLVSIQSSERKDMSERSSSLFNRYIRLYK